MAEPVRIVGGNYNGNSNEGIQAQVTRAGCLLVQEDGWIASDIDDDSTGSTGTTYYYGFVDRDARWYIMRRDTSLGQFRFVAGESGYTLAWTGRASLSYD